jgi:23S rRNA (pseudouridine1915-N3)-methyltransferase
MPKVKLLSIGKNKERWLEEAFSEYIKRLNPTVQIECQWLAEESQLPQAAAKEKNVICLDAAGRSLTSEQFAVHFQQSLERGGARLTYVIGGAEGLTEEMRKRYPLISLSPLTFTHQMVRLILLEQIYRATEILKGSRYHK